MEEILSLNRESLSVTDISELTGFDRKTISKYLKQPEIPRYGPRAPCPSKLDPFKPYIEERLRAGVWNAVVLLREIQERGYQGGYTILKDYLRPKRQAAREVAVRRFETPPGRQAQVDWGHIGHCIHPDGTRQSLSGFVLTLGHSRAMFADVATDERLPTFLRMHEEAFLALGGVPREILYDRMKTVVLGLDDRGEIRWHPVFLDFARHWGFTPRLCRGYRPQTKGKVESGIGYLRKNFLCGRKADSVSDLSGQLFVWTREVANRRVHGTTHRVVLEAWQEELPLLKPLVSPYPYIPQESRKVGRDAYVNYRGSRYSVPWKAAGLEVSVREADGHLEVCLEGERLARHPLTVERHQVVAIPAHHAGIPLGRSDEPSSRKAEIFIRDGAPLVEVRPLACYEAKALGGETQ